METPPPHTPCASTAPCGPVAGAGVNGVNGFFFPFLFFYCCKIRINFATSAISQCTVLWY